MTQEEKAKRYDETLEQLRGLIEGTREDKCAIVEEDIIDIFTELKESEDEKVKRIIHSISNKISFHLHDIFTEEEFQCFDAWSNAWLEKQMIMKATIEIKLGRERHRLVPCEGNGCTVCSLYTMCYVMKACGRKLCDVAYLETTEWRDNQNHRFELLAK